MSNIKDYTRKFKSPTNCGEKRSLYGKKGFFWAFVVTVDSLNTSNTKKKKMQQQGHLFAFFLGKSSIKCLDEKDDLGHGQTSFQTCVAGDEPAFPLGQMMGVKPLVRKGSHPDERKQQQRMTTPERFLVWRHMA